MRRDSSCNIHPAASAFNTSRLYNWLTWLASGYLLGSRHGPEPEPDRRTAKKTLGSDVRMQEGKRSTELF